MSARRAALPLSGSSGPVYPTLESCRSLLGLIGIPLEATGRAHEFLEETLGGITQMTGRLTASEVNEAEKLLWKAVEAENHHYGYVLVETLAAWRLVTLLERSGS